MIGPIQESAQYKDPLTFLRFGFLARIDSSTEIGTGTNRYKYTVQPGTLAGPIDDFTFTARGSTLDALNVFELSNTSSNVQGVNPSTLPSGFSFEAATGYVMCWPSRIKSESTNIEPVWLFCVPLTVDGSCP